MRDFLSTGGVSLPANLPVEDGTKFQFVLVNMRHAATKCLLRFTVLPQLLTRADEVIELNSVFVIPAQAAAILARTHVRFWASHITPSSIVLAKLICCRGFRFGG